MSNIVNLTPHEVTIFHNGQAHRFPGCLNPARVVPINKKVFDFVIRTEVQSVGNLPEPREGFIYIVSNVVRCALPNRKDLCSPTGAVRGKYNEVIGSKYLTLN